ncbi:hypothetical protein [Spirochaeta dissipatitropha]
MKNIFVPDQSSHCLYILSGAESDSVESRRLYKQGLPEGTIIHFDDLEVRNSTVWKPNIWTERGGEMALTGPYLEGLPFESILTDTFHAVIYKLRKLNSAYAYAEEHSIHLPAPGQESVYFLDNGSIFFVPRNLAYSFEPADSQLPHIHSDHDHSPFCQYSILSLCTRLLSGTMNQNTDPYEGINPYYYQPGLPAEISEQINQSLLKKKTLASEQIDGILETIDKLSAQQHFQLPPEESPKLQTAIRIYKIKTRISRFINQKRSKIYTSAVLLAAILFLYLSGLGTPLQEEDFSNLGPREIVRLYYESFNSLDHQTMDRITAGRTAQNEIRSILQIDLADKTSRGHTARRSIIAPEEYLEGNIPGRFQNIYGITDISIKELSRSTSSAEYYVEATQWAPAEISLSEVQNAEEYERIMLQSPDIRRIRRGDYLRLQYSRRGWQIQQLEFNQIEELPAILRSDLLPD